MSKTVSWEWFNRKYQQLNEKSIIKTFQIMVRLQLLNVTSSTGGQQQVPLIDPLHGFEGGTFIFYQKASLLLFWSSSNTQWECICVQMPLLFILPKKDFPVILFILGIGHMWVSRPGSQIYQLLNLCTWDCKTQDMLKEDWHLDQSFKAQDGAVQFQGRQ